MAPFTASIGEVGGSIMSDNIPLRTQHSCTENEYYRINVFSNAQLNTMGSTRPLEQLIVFITRASENSERLDMLQKQLDQGAINVRYVYSNHFLWRRSRGVNLRADLVMGDFCANKEVHRRKIDEMKLGENLVFTMPKSDASSTTVKLKLVNESRDIILETGELNLEQSMLLDETRLGVEHGHEGNQVVEMEA